MVGIVSGLAIGLLGAGLLLGWRLGSSTRHRLAERHSRLQGLDELQASRDRLALYLDVAGVILLALDTEGRIQLINRRGCELLGASREELVGTDWFAECLPADESPRIKSLFSSLMAGGDGLAERAENSVRTRSGELRLIAWRNAVTRDAGGRTTGVVASGEDVTALRASERALQEALAWQEAIVEGDPDGIFISDSDEKAAACVVDGASDYVLKGSPVRLPATVTAALKGRRQGDLKAEAEAALRESEERYRTLVDSAPDAIVTVDSAGVVRLWNAAAEDIFGYSAAEMLGSALGRIIPEAGRKAHDRILRARAASGEPLRRTSTVTARRRDGTEFPAEVSLSSVEPQGDTRFTAVIRDRTDATEAQRAIEKLSRQHEILLHSAGEGILGLASDGTVTFANPAALVLLDQEAVDLIGESLSSIMPGSQDDGPASAILSCLRSGTEFRGDLDFLRTGGRSFPAWASLTNLTEGDGGGGVLVVEDITERKSHEEALRASEASYRSLVDNAPYGIYRSTVGGRFLSVNPALVTMLGYRWPAELLTLDLTTSLYPDPLERGRLSKQVLENGPTFHIQTSWTRKDGSLLDVRLTGRKVRAPEGGSDVYEVLVEDLTERTVLEKQLRQAQKMETVGQLTGGIAHDFNNVLAVILLNTEMAIAEVERGRTVDREDLQTIQDAARRASNITRKLLGFSRHADLQPEPTRLNKVVASLSGMLRTALPENIDLDIQASEDAGIALVDAGSIEQMVLNLATNSRDALPDGGKVTVKVNGVYLGPEECPHLPGLAAGKHVCITVADNGAGMDENTLGRIFDPFFTTKPSEVGTGLGMAMVYGLTKQQHGFVDVTSELGVGTTTHLYFPTIVGEPVTDVPTPSATERAWKAGTILLVEDENNLRAVATRALEGSGFRVLAAADGEEALDLYAIHGESIDVVFSDIVLPGMSGLDLMKTLQSRQGHIPFVLTSGYSGQTQADGALDPGIPFVRKPWSLTDLLAVIRSAMPADSSSTQQGATKSAS